MIEKNGINENALEISSKAHTVRMLVHGDKIFFSATDILKACGVKAPTKWIERNANDRPDIVTQRFDYPIKTAHGYRKIKMIFVSGGVGKRLVKFTACPDETKQWLMEEVFAYRATKASDNAGADDDFHKEAMVPVPPKKDELNRRIDSILLELLEIKRYIAGASNS